MPRRDGRVLAARYSLAPNRLSLCGPDENKAMLDYLVENTSDPDLAFILQRFEGMYPNLKFIAEANGIPDPFDPRVVEAYWVGNNLLERADLKRFYQHLKEAFGKRFSKKALERFLGYVPLGARTHHSFHVFSVPMRTGHLEVPHTLETMDECRISWGTVKALEGDHMVVEYQPLVLQEGKLALGPPQEKRIIRVVRGKTLLPHLRVAGAVSFHWGCVCDTLAPQHLQNLEKYTRYHMNLFNRLPSAAL